MSTRVYDHECRSPRKIGFEASCQRHDALRHWDPEPHPTLAQRIAYTADQIKMIAAMIDWEDWQLNPDPVRMRAELRRSLAVWTEDLNQLLAEMKEAA